MPTPAALVPLAEHRGPDAERLRADVAAASAIVAPVVDEPLGSFLDGAWVWAPDGGAARGLVVRAGLRLPDIAPVRAEVSSFFDAEPQPGGAEPEPGVVASGSLPTGSRWQVSVGRLVTGAPAGAVLTHLWRHTDGAGLGGCLALFAPGLDPRPQVEELVTALDALRTETVPPAARIGLARGLRMAARLARASGVGLRPGGGVSGEELESRMMQQVLLQLPADAEQRVLGVLRLDPVDPAHPWADAEVETILPRPVAELVAAAPAGPLRTGPATRPGRTPQPRRDLRVPLLVGAAVVVLVVVLLSLALLLG